MDGSTEVPPACFASGELLLIGAAAVTDPAASILAAPPLSAGACISAILCIALGASALPPFDSSGASAHPAESRIAKQAAIAAKRLADIAPSLRQDLTC